MTGNVHEAGDADSSMRLFDHVYTCIFLLFCTLNIPCVGGKKSLKIAKGLSEIVNRRKTDITTVEEKRKKIQTSNGLPNTTHKTKDQATRKVPS
jgi:hypothetical protein